jgi:hypothetical protein
MSGKRVGGFGRGDSNSPPTKFLRSSKNCAKLNPILKKMLKIAEFRKPTPSECPGKKVAVQF